MTTEKIIQDCVEANYYYDGEDPLKIANIYQIDPDTLSSNESFYNLYQPGDWFIDDGVYGSLVRVIDGEVKEIWTNS